MKIFILIVILLKSLVGFSQFGRSYSDVLLLVKKDSSIIDYEETKSDDGYLCIGAFKKDTSDVILVGYYFNKDLICIRRRLICSKSTLNNTISGFNRQFVKISELEWKNYVSNNLYSITIPNGRTFYIDITKP